MGNTEGLSAFTCATTESVGGTWSVCRNLTNERGRNGRDRSLERVSRAVNQRVKHVFHTVAQYLGVNDFNVDDSPRGCTPRPKFTLASYAR